MNYSGDGWPDSASGIQTTDLLKGSVWRDNRLVMAFKDEDVDSVIEQTKRLPSTHRRGYGGSRDDVAEGADGMPTKVPTPETPDDRFS